MICDMHTHSLNSHDSKCPIAETAKACIQKGIDTFAVTDHCDIQFYKEHDIRRRIGNSVSDVHRENESFDGKIKILKGIELGEGIWNMNFTSEILAANEYDVVIGSVHQIRYDKYPIPYSWEDFSKISENELHEIMSRYFDDVLETVCTVPCDIMAHLTCPLRYINGKFGRSFDISPFDSKIRQILTHIISRDIALEVNTSCLGTAFDSLMPDERIIKMFVDMGGTLVTLGSDAHAACNVGMGFDRAVAALKKHGINKCCYFKNRTAVMYDI